MTRSPSLVTFILVIGLNSRKRRSSADAAAQVVRGPRASTSFMRQQAGVRVGRACGARAGTRSPVVPYSTRLWAWVTAS